MEEKIDHIVEDLFLLTEMKVSKKEHYPRYQRIFKQLTLEKEKNLFYARMRIQHEQTKSFQRMTTNCYEVLYSLLKEIENFKREPLLLQKKS